MKKIILATSLIMSSITLVGCVDDDPYTMVEKFARNEDYPPTTLKVRDGDRLFRNGIEVKVFEDVVTGEYTLTNAGYFELVRKNH